MSVGRRKLCIVNHKLNDEEIPIRTEKECLRQVVDGDVSLRPPKKD